MKDINRLIRIYAKVPNFDCKGCGECCGPVECSSIERKRIRAYASEHDFKVGDFFGSPMTKFAKAIFSDWRCPFLNLEKRCQIYEVRPLICRLQGVTPGLPCPKSKAEMPLGRALAHKLLHQAEALKP